MLKNEDIDVVVVATADKAHKQATVDALKAGCHVMCEKPMSLFVEECEEMVRTADETGKLLMVGQVCRYAPGFVKAKSLVEQGVIGDLYFVESEYAHDYSGREGVDNWRADKDREPIIGGACHAIDLLRWIAGDPIETSAYSNHKMLTDWPVNDTTVAIMKFPNNVIGKVFTSIGCKRDYTMRTVLYGSKGTIIVNNTDPDLTLFLDKIEGAPFAAGQLADTEEKLIKHMIKVSINNHNVAEEHRQMLDAVIDGKPLITTGREGARTVMVCRAVVESAKTGMPVKINYTV
jgi:predicted dehydrogenase